MILYLDTSSVVKLYVDERYSGDVKGWVEEAEIAAVCRIAYPETLSALNRRLKSNDISKESYAVIVKTFAKDWNAFAVVDFDEIEAGLLVEKHGIRGFDAVHLSAAKILKNSHEKISLCFSSFDQKLNSAATAEGFTVLNPRR